MTASFLTALPVYNEEKYVRDVLQEVRKYSKEILVVNDGSQDGTADVLAEFPEVRVVHHEQNRGYGAALASAFEYAQRENFEVLVTIDCDGQHQPCRIPRFVEACERADIVSGSRYLKQYADDSLPPADRRQINRRITEDLNRRLGLHLTDAFCGFKAYRVATLSQLHITEFGYAMPLQVWAQAARAGLRIVELPVPLIYLDESRSFGGALDDAWTRLQHYREVLDRSLQALEEGADGVSCPPESSRGACSQ